MKEKEIYRVQVDRHRELTKYDGSAGGEWVSWWGVVGLRMLFKKNCKSLIGDRAA